MKILPALIPALFLAGAVHAQDNFNIEEAVAVCAECHGEAGLPAEPDYPIIWGQQFFYIYTQLKDFAAERRANEIMVPIAADFSRDQMKAISQYFADQPWPAISAHAQEGDKQISEVAAASGQCSACHGKWQGDSRIPRLAGQQPGYLDKTMLDFKHDVRMNAPDLNSTFKQLDDDTIATMARYLSSL